MDPFPKFTFAKQLPLTTPIPGPAVIFVYAPWCGWSKRAAPLFDATAKLHTDIAFFVHDNSDKYFPGITQVPTYVGYNRLKKAKRATGDNDLDEAITFAKM